MMEGRFILGEMAPSPKPAKSTEAIPKFAPNNFNLPNGAPMAKTTKSVTNGSSNSSINKFIRFSIPIIFFFDEGVEDGKEEKECEKGFLKHLKKQIHKIFNTIYFFFFKNIAIRRAE